MKQKTIDINPYSCSLTIIFDKDFYYVEKEYNLPSLDQFGAVTFKNEKEYRNYVVVFTDKKHLSNIAHEIVHIKNHIYLDCAMQLDRINDEPEAYLTGWLFEQIYNFLKKA